MARRALREEIVREWNERSFVNPPKELCDPSLGRKRVTCEPGEPARLASGRDAASLRDRNHARETRRLDVHLCDMGDAFVLVLADSL
jgi:hypothetical protein